MASALRHLSVMNCYRVHNLTIGCDFVVAALAMAGNRADPDAVTIAAGTLPPALDTPQRQRNHYQTAPGRVLIRAPGVGRLLVENGQKITYERATGCTANLLAAHVLGSGLAAIHHQRGNLVLHGASLCRGGQAYLICGKSGAGKSTTAAHLLANGGQTLGDDVAAIGDGPEYLVHPGPMSTRLSDEALARLPHFAAQAGTERCAAGKRIASTATHFSPAPLPLGGIIVLDTGPAAVVAARRLEWNDAFAALQMHTFRKRFITRDMLPLLRRKWGELAHRVPVWQVARPEARDTLTEVVAQAEGAIAAMTHAITSREQLPAHATGS